uniref:Uncharacterized protein n=1 Tax=Graphocephala atropunctata TaxID=36148 RepID=A0A1B6LC29_9HEMI
MSRVRPPVFIYNMPAVNPNNPSQGGAQRTTFRPPWVKEGPTPLPMPTAPWTARGREATAGAATAPEEPKKPEKPGPRRLSKVTIVPSQPQPESVNQEVISQANLKWKPKAQEKKQETIVTFSKPQTPKVIDKSQERLTPLSKVQQLPAVKEKESPKALSLKTPVKKRGSRTASNFWAERNTAKRVYNYCPCGDRVQAQTVN